MSATEIVNDWFNDRLRAGALGRDTEAYNQVRAALPDLIARLTPEPPAVTVPPPAPAATPQPPQPAA